MAAAYFFPWPGRTLAEVWPRDENKSHESCGLRASSPQLFFMIG